ncbi:glutamate synthase [Intrasporangium chromatireducens Q5-1]|uniref:Glutamate synthase n=1 Tax=Intrasporangium chromatireducens Q5-1 TaxID=584657 RepID=W9GHJ8_9MICO|nr:NAD(P)-binding protein [Intrasporangium chromatireducens]EWT05706.1 glutamate synthase [Intrasporangium chromatireducens Q5-1]
MSEQERDLTPLAPLGLGRRRAGPVRASRPVYVDLLPPCNAGCPAGENIQAWLALVRDGEPERAWRELTVDNPLPAVHGRVCYHPCESACNRLELDAAVSIHGVERYLGDLAIERGWQFERSAPPSGRRVLVVGSGPSGLSAAYHLSRLGHDVVVRDNAPEPGGMMRYGIPAYRLPRDVLDAEVGRLRALGVRFEQGHRVTDLEAERHEGGFDAVFVAVGAHLSKRVEIPNMDARRVLDAVTFLRAVESGEQEPLHGTVAVYGGGNTAMDAARVAKRVGATDSVIVYRRSRAQMPAHEEEAVDAEEEGIRINWLRTIAGMGEGDLTVEVQELDEHGRPHGTGRFETLAADTVILALGQESDTGFLHGVPGVEFDDDVVRVSPATLMTGAAGVFAGGDAVPSQRTVTVAVGHGKRAARSIDAYLRQTAPSQAPKHPLASFERLNLWYFGDHDRREQPELDPATRTTGFDEVVAGLTPQEAAFEAGRCLSCGNCFECDGCLGSCPEDAVIKLGKGQRYRFDYTACTGCGSCYRQCPVHAIEMVPEDAGATPAQALTRTGQGG